MFGSFLPGLGWLAPPKSIRAWEPTLLWNQFHSLTGTMSLIGLFSDFLFGKPNPSRRDCLAAFAALAAGATFAG